MKTVFLRDCDLNRGRFPHNQKIKMKYILTADEFKALSEDLQKEYKLEGETATLTLEGHDDHLIPKAKRDIEAEHRKAAEKKVAEIEAREAKLLKDLEASKGNKGEVEEIRKSHEAEIKRITEEFQAKEQAAKAESHKALIREEAARFANEKFTVPTAISRLYQDRLTVEEVEGQPVIRVLDANGKGSVQSLDQLQNEFLTNKEFAPIIKASKGNGGGANPSSGGQGGGATKQITRSEFDALDMVSKSKFSIEGGTVVDD